MFPLYRQSSTPKIRLYPTQTYVPMQASGVGAEDLPDMVHQYVIQQRFLQHGMNTRGIGPRPLPQASRRWSA